MNNPFNYQNDLTGFRSQLATEVAKHDQNVQNSIARAVGEKQKIVAKAKELKSAGEELVKQGLEAEIVPVAVGKAYKGGKALYSAVKNRFSSVAGEENPVQSIGSENTLGDITGQLPSDGQVPVPRAGVATENTTSSGGGEIEMSDLSQPAEGGAMDINEPTDVFGGISEEDLMGSAPFTRSSRPPPGNQMAERVGQAEQTASENAENLASNAEQSAREGAEAVQSVGESIGQEASNAGNAISDAVSGAEQTASEAISGAGEALSGAGDAVSSGISALSSGAGDLTGEGIEGAIGTASGELAELAGATSWIPFVGEVFGGLAAIGGLATAGYGLYEEIKGGDDESKAEQQKIQPRAVPKLNVAGSFIAPQQTSVEM